VAEPSSRSVFVRGCSSTGGLDGDAPVFRPAAIGRATLMERTAALARAFTAKEAALTRAENTIAALNEQVAALESTRAVEKQGSGSEN
jgi:hypothetical protein